MSHHEEVFLRNLRMPRNVAYRGTPSRLLMRIPNNHWYVIADRTALFPTTQWRHVCFELFEKLRTQLNSEATQLTIDRISLRSTVMITGLMSCPFQQINEKV